MAATEGLGVRDPAVPGEIAHHLRSVLDHVAWQLVLDAGGKPRTGAGGMKFPIFWDYDVYKTKGRKKVQGASDLAVRFIDSFQPYQVE